MPERSPAVTRCTLHRLFVFCMMVSRLSYEAQALAQPSTSATSDRPKAEDDWGEGDDAVGFATAAEHDPITTREPLAAPAASAEPRGDLAVFGFLRSDDALWLERLGSDPVAKLRQSLDATLRYRNGALRLQLEGHLARDLVYELNTADEGAATLEAYESLALLREGYASWSHRGIDVTVGKQVLAWGQGDVLGLLDLVNPRDSREPGLADLNDLRLGAWMTRWGVSFSNQRWDFMIVHRSDFGLRSPVFGPFSPLRPLFTATVPPSVREIRFVDRQAGGDFANQQLFARWSTVTADWDMAFYAASVLDPVGVLQTLVPNQEDPETLRLVLDHPRYTVFGQSGSLPYRSWLFKWELATSLKRSFDLAPDADNPGFARRITSLLGALAGVVYTGFDDTRLLLEGSRSVALPDTRPLLFPFDKPALAFKVTRSFWRGDLTLDALFIGYGIRLQYGWLARLELDYAVSDSWRVGLGLISYAPGSQFGFLSGFDRHDRATLTLRYDFSLE